MLHTERAHLLHRWAEEHDLTVVDWGPTDGERPAENVQLILQVAQATLTAGLGALISESVKVFFDYRKGKAKDGGKPPVGGGDARSSDPGPPEVPLFGLTIVNESGGTVVVMHAPRPAEVGPLIAQVTDPEWSEHHLVV